MAEEEEVDIREMLAEGKDLDKLVILARSRDGYFKKLIECLDDDLWVVSKNALVVIRELLEEKDEIQEPLATKLVSMVRKSEATLLTYEIGKTFGKLAVLEPPLIRRMIPILFANYNIGNPKVKINMTYVIEEIARSNPNLLASVIGDVKKMLYSNSRDDILVALNFIAALGGHNFVYVAPYLPRLLDLLHHENEVVRAAAIETLSDLAMNNRKLRKVVIEKLEELNDPDSLVRRVTRENISKLMAAEKG
ncbi:hypothetical protein A3L12_07520 [Thermococcus sp. P6]|uniref:PH0542 domain-containing protein n=1 Tax=Thermococcus sp. P6 TaxID=122420 RepID=UPI000B59A508|nr:PH0542 domain-containing protein [Thermococcus sp. P6]ASJ11154.1 hypothetical protein A3L12_07520 [Thermococcus sp. P6]